MAKCGTCGIDYEHSFEVFIDGRSYTFDSLECAIHKLAPVCEGCGCHILDHGFQLRNRLFCSAHCAWARGLQGLANFAEAPRRQAAR